MEYKIKCDYCGCEVEEDNQGSESACITCWEFWEAEYEEYDED